MSDTRSCQNGLGFDTRGTVCIDAYRVLDTCRDRDCFENIRVYLSSYGEQVLQNATSTRVRSASMLWAYVGVDEIPFNCGFYQITIRYFISVNIESCVGIGRSQTYQGLAIAEKTVILFGGDGHTLTFSSDSDNSYCGIGNLNTVQTSDPIAKVEVVEPIVLDTKVVCEDDPCGCPDTFEIPECLRQTPDGDVLLSTNARYRLYISLGVFSVVRMERPTQLLVNATDYSVPDKECVPRQSDENPCCLFRTIAFPVAEFKGTVCPETTMQTTRSGGCSCHGERRDDPHRREDGRREEAHH